jgi:penicillin-binding protein 1B
MALKIRIPGPAREHPFSKAVLRVALIGLAAAALVFLVVFGFLYIKYRSVVDDRLKQPLFASTAKIYAAPREVRPGQKLSIELIANELREAGYSAEGAGQTSPLGTYSEDALTITVHPGPESYHTEDSATIRITGGVVQSIADDRGQPLSSYELEPLLITGLSNGVNFWRLGSAAAQDIFTGHKEQGGSTLTMQLARGFFLSPEKTWKRKLIEIIITFQLEHRFTKQKIFEMYSNEINLGQRGSFSIDGFGEAAQTYFGKDASQLNLAECATLAGMIQRPNYFNPYRHPDRTIERRNLVLDSMVETGAITKNEAESAKGKPLHLSVASVDASDAPYFVDLVHEQLLQRLGDRDFNREGLRIYTSLDPDLQRVAASAVESTMHIIDEQVDKLHAHQKPGETYQYPQVALVALNPHTGQVLALIGGRNYGASQLNHAVAKRPTGSIFKPFVYAAAFSTAVEGTILPGQNGLFSPVTMLSDEQTTYDVGGQAYTPRNFEGEYHGQVTARYALMRSLNNATIGLAGMVGFDRVASLARDAGIKSARGTPAVAIGAYDATPLDMSGAYTAFANHGLYLEPWMLASIRTSTGDVVTDYSPASKQLLDPRVAYLTTSLMENVLRGGGTGAGVRGMGFTAPAAGKTGTSHDAWFAGFTSNLLCVVWVGNDDYSDVQIEGARAAAPIWAEFMKRAVQLPQYSDTNAFAPPEGVQIVSIDPATNLLSDETCPDGYNAAFLDGTAPTETCDQGADHRNLLQKIFGLGKSGN